jgi:hypothetical protein
MMISIKNVKGEFSKPGGKIIQNPMGLCMSCSQRAKGKDMGGGVYFIS